MYRNAKIIKTINNNHVLVKHNDEEKILSGKGIGFGKRLGDMIGLQNVENVYIKKMDNCDNMTHYSNYND